MAGIGKVGSFATTQAPTDNILQSMQYVDQLDYRAKQDEAKDAAAKAKKDAENLKEIEDYRNKFPVNLTGNQSINDLTIPYASQARDRAAELTRKIQSTNNPQEKEKYMRERNNVVQSFDILKQVPDMLIAKTKEIQDGIEKGKYNERDIDAVQEVLGQVDTGKATLYVDEYGQARATIFKTDEEGNPTEIIEKDLSMSELINSATPFLKPTYDAKSGIAEQFLSQVKLDKSSIQTGFTTIEQTKLTDRVKNLAKQKGKEISTIDSEVYEIWQRMGNEPKRKFTDDDRKEVASYIENDLISRYNSEYEKDIDQSGALANRKFNAEEKEKKVKRAIAVFDAQTARNDFSKKSVNLDNVNPNMVALPEGNVKFLNLGGSESGLNNGYITGFALQTNGNILMTGKALVDKGQKFKVGGSSVNLDQLNALIVDPNTPTPIKEEAQAELDSYSVAANYGQFVIKPSSVELEGYARKAGYNEGELEAELKKMNPKYKETNNNNSGTVKGGSVR